MGGERNARYAAFMSYSHKDAAAARWLHRRLESYRIPRRLVGREGERGPVPARLTPIFRDREELPAAGDLSEKVRAALAASRALVVICSPDAAASQWVGREVRLFRELHPGRPIFAAILDGEPHQCFPTDLSKMGQVKLGTRDQVDPEIRRVKRFYIMLRGLSAPGPQDPARPPIITGLGFYLVPHPDDGPHGKKFDTLALAEAAMADFARPGGSQQGLLPPPLMDDPTPLDFSISKRCIIGLRIVGNFWRFADTDAITTKNEILTEEAIERYYNLYRHNEQTVSFYASKPVKEEPGADNKKHPINIHVDFLNTLWGTVLPVILDPDIENKGDE